MNFCFFFLSISFSSGFALVLCISKREMEIYEHFSISYMSFVYFIRLFFTRPSSDEASNIKKCLIIKKTVITTKHM